MVPTLWLTILLGITVTTAEVWERCKPAQCKGAEPKVPSAWPSLGFYQTDCANSCYFDGWPSALCEKAVPCCDKVALANKNGALIGTRSDIAFFCGINPCNNDSYYNTTSHLCLKKPHCSSSTSNTPGKQSQCVPNPNDKKPASHYKISSKAVECMKGFEGYCQSCYLDDKCIWTIGFGFAQKSKVLCQKLEPMTIEQANAVYKQKIVEYENAIKRLVKVDITQGQYDALVDLAYNRGPTGFSRSETLKLVNNHQFSQAIQALRSVTGGSATRRHFEADLFESNYSHCPSYKHTKCPTVCKKRKSK